MVKIKSLAIACLVLLLASCKNSKQPPLPNVLILYADDLGWSDLGCYGSTKNETPHLDNLASEGLRFTRAYAPAPICSASRASILTGKSPARLNFEFVSTNGRITGKPLLPPKRTFELPLEEITLGEIAQNAGYRTAFYGKWHVAEHNGGYLKCSDTHGPFQQGFEAGSDHYGSHPYNEKNREMVYLPEGTFPEDSLVLKAINFLKVQKNRNQPFLMIFSSYYVHTPVIPNNSWLIEKYQKRLPDATENEIKYAAFVETLDYHYGQLLKALKDFGLEDNTLVIFTSDNGGHPAYSDNAPLHGNKWNLYEGGIREPFIVNWSGNSNMQTGECSMPVIQWDILPTLCELTGQPVPTKVEGKSLFPLLVGHPSEFSREAIYWHFPYYHPPKSYEGTKPCSAILNGHDKLIYFYEDERLELYNLKNDPGEKSDLAGEKPEFAAQMKEALMESLDEADARFPLPNPGYVGNEKE